MYKKAPEGMVAQQFTISDANIPVGTLACITGDMTIAQSGGPVIGEIVAKDTHTMKATVELFCSKIMDVVAGTGGLVAGHKADLSGETEVASGEGTQMSTDPNTYTSVITMTQNDGSATAGVLVSPGKFMVLQGGAAGAACVVACP